MRLRSDRYGTPTARNTYSDGKSEASDLRGAGSIHRRQGQMFFDDSLSPGAQAVSAGDMGLAEIHRYGEATAKRCHWPGTPLSW